MTDLLFQTNDRFLSLYDLVQLVEQGNSSRNSLLALTHLAPNIVDDLLSFMITECFVKTAGDGTHFRVTKMGPDFLKDYKGMRKFLS